MSAALAPILASRSAGPMEDAAALAALVRESVASGIARRALLLRLSTLPRALARPHHLRLAREAVAPLALADRARCFTLPNTDLVLVWRGDTPAEAAVLAALAHLFADEAESLPDPAALVACLRLPDEADRLLAAIDASRPPPPPARRRAAGGRMLDLTTLAALEAALAGADMARFARRPPVGAWIGTGVGAGAGTGVGTGVGTGFALAWERRALSVAELAETLVPAHDVRADPWLHRRLTRTLDRRLLALLAAPGELRGAAPFGLDLNVGSVLAPEFLRFDAALPPDLRGQVTLGLHAADAMADPAAFLFARDFARARHYRLLLRGAGAELLEVVPRAGLGLDLVQLRWSPALAAADPARLAEDAARIVLAGTDSAEALAWGKAVGIGLFRGALVAGTARPSGKPIHMEAGRRGETRRSFA